nr:putative tRNA (guanine(26)-N(2))-dimethyltransferase 2 [Ipomoea batatas]
MRNDGHGEEIAKSKSQNYLIQIQINHCYWFFTTRISRWVQLVPSFDPGHHSIGQLDEVLVNLPELGLDLFGNLEVTALDSGAVLWKSNRLEKGDQLLLPVDTLVFLLKVHERIASFAVPNVGQTEKFGKKERERAYKAVIINGVDVLLLGNHVAEATASGILEGNAGSLGAQNPVDVIAVVELIVKPVGDPDSL